jgi:hypothetical protein
LAIARSGLLVQRKNTIARGVLVVSYSVCSGVFKTGCLINIHDAWHLVPAVAPISDERQLAGINGCIMLRVFETSK